jgi:purine nucleosidase
MDDAHRVIVDTDTAGDDTQAILYALETDRLEVEALTTVAGNVAFDREVENAKYTLDLADRTDVPVYEGARRPLSKDYEFATDVHGEGGLGGELFPETGIDSAPGYAPERIVESARSSPGDLSLLCIGPLTNVALALHREPDLGEYLDRVWVMGGNANCRGNVTPAAEFNFWVDPDAASVVVGNLAVTLVDWGISLRDGRFGPDVLERLDGIDTPYGDFFGTVTRRAREVMAERGTPGTSQPDSLTAAVAAHPELVEDAGTYHVDVDDREGMTRGYTLVDETGTTGEPPRTTVVESVDADRFLDSFEGLLAEGDPDGPLAD